MLRHNLFPLLDSKSNRHQQIARWKNSHSVWRRLLESRSKGDGTEMKLSCWMILLQLVGYVCPSMAAERQPQIVVRKLSDQVIVRHPLGVPKGADKAAIRLHEV